MSDDRWTFTNAQSLIEEALTTLYFTPDDDGVTPIPALFVPGKGSLVLALGENASGKSFLRRLVSQMCREHGIEAIPLSMEGRGGSYGGLRGMIYGDESWQSTGVCSVSTVRSGIRTCQERSTPHMIYWDEPDLGLSENGAAGVGQAIAKYMVAPNPRTTAAIVVTHSKALVQQIVDDIEPHYLHLGSVDPPPTVHDWLRTPVVPRSIEEISEAGHHRFKLIQKILQGVRREST